MEQLIEEYRESLKVVRKLHEKAEGKDKSIIAGMIKDLKYTIKWMETGRRPESRRGAEQSYDPLTFERRYGDTKLDPGNVIDKQVVIRNEILKTDRNHMRQAIKSCTRREKLVFILAHVNMMSLQEIADKLEVTKSTVQTTLKRSENKIKKQIESDMFLRAYSEKW